MKANPCEDRTCESKTMYIKVGPAFSHWQMIVAIASSSVDRGAEFLVEATNLAF